MKAIPTDTRSRAKIAVALLLTFSAGMVDIVGYISIYHLFVAHMTGDTVHLGNQLVIGGWGAAAKAAATLCSFVAGSIIGRVIIEAGSRRKIRAIASVTLLAEAALVLIFVQMSAVAPLRMQPAYAVCILLGLLAAAMGLQTATLTHIGPLTIHTTFVTGMLNKFAQAISEWLFWAHDQWRNGTRWAEVLWRSLGHSATRDAELMSAIWLSYMLGSVAGTLLHSLWSVQALYLPMLALILSAGVDQFKPLSIEEEQT